MLRMRFYLTRLQLNSGVGQQQTFGAHSDSPSWFMARASAGAASNSITNGNR
jgi:hypothetical protein